MAPPFPLRGAHALVTGVTGPLARVLAVALAEAGAHVSVTTLHDERAEEVQANSILNECWAAGAQGQAKTVDLTDQAAVEAAVHALERAVAPIDILVHAATLETTLADWPQALRPGTAAFVASQVVGRHMRARAGGRIVLVVPVDRAADPPARALIEAARGGLLGFARALAAEWGPGAHAVTVSALGVASADGTPPPGGAPDEPPRDLRGALLYLMTAEAPLVHGVLLVADAPIVNRAS